jgi:hypothetical protein
MIPVLHEQRMVEIPTAQNLTNANVANIFFFRKKCKSEQTETGTQCLPILQARDVDPDPHYTWIQLVLWIRIPQQVNEVPKFVYWFFINKISRKNCVAPFVQHITGRYRYYNTYVF